MTMTTPRTVLLDLDGTLTDPLPGIAACVQHALLAQGLPLPADPARCATVGDREHDALAARRHGMTPIGVLWGYGRRVELEQAGVRRLLERPDELPGAIPA